MPEAEPKKGVVVALAPEPEIELKPGPEIEAEAAGVSPAGNACAGGGRNWLKLMAQSLR